jgi:hypothetical protein
LEADMCESAERKVVSQAYNQETMLKGADNKLRNKYSISMIVFGLYPSSCVLNTGKYDVSETGSVLVMFSSL